MISVQKPKTSNQGTRVSHSKASLRPDCDQLTRTSWSDASLAYAQIQKGRAAGNKRSLRLRIQIQSNLATIGCYAYKKKALFFFMLTIPLVCMCMGLMSSFTIWDLTKLWVLAGGRLEAEMSYTKLTHGEGIGGRDLMITHTLKEEAANVLHTDTLLAHQQVVKAAVHVSVDVFDISWSLKDVCNSLSFPLSEEHYLDMTLENLSPCVIITPLDCFWEGSKLLGPEYPVKIPGLSMNAVQWANLNPQELIETVKKYYSSSNTLQAMETFMKRAGITTAYQDKPCLNPNDELCPSTAPNKKSLKPLNIGAELTGGCFGFATKYMQWPEGALLGGVSKNKTGHIIRAEALQTIIELMSEEEMFKFWKDHIKVHNLDWNVEKAKMVLEAIQRRITQVVIEEAETSNLSSRHSVNVFSHASLNDVMKDFSKTNFRRIALGPVVILVCICASFFHCCNPLNSQYFLLISGFALCVLAVVSGLVFASTFGYYISSSIFAFNIISLQVVPSIGLGLGMSNVYLVINEYMQCLKLSCPKELLTAEIFKRTGLNIIFNCLSQLGAFFIASFIQMPALRTAVLQLGIIVVFHFVIIVIVYLACISFAVKKHFKCDEIPTREEKNEKHKKSHRSHPSLSAVVPIRQAVTHALPPDGSHVVTVLMPSGNQPEDTWPHIGTHTTSYENLSTMQSSHKDLSLKDKLPLKKDFSITKDCQNGSLLTQFLNKGLIPAVQKTPVKVIFYFVYVTMLLLGIWGTFRVEEGLDLTDFVPKNTNEYDFLSQRTKYFGLFNMFAVTKGNFKYPTNQRLLYDYHEAFTRINKIKNDNGEPPEFWLTMFRDWLLGLQKAFDEHWDSGCITQEGWCKNATDDAIMAYKLLVQTGRVDNPIDKSLVKTVQLVDANGIINTKPFYNYLSAWVSNDPLAYSASRAYFSPEPRQWIHDPQDVDLKMPKSQPLVYAQMPFFMDDMSSTEEITTTIREVRALCEKFENRGLPNFPSGLLFTYWEQFINLRQDLLLLLLYTFLFIFFVFSLLLFNPWAAAVEVVILFVITLELFGFMGIIGIRLNAVTAVILIITVGMSVGFTACFLMAFLTNIGSRQRRMVMALEQMFSPVLYSGLPLLVGSVMLSMSEFDFIFRYFFTIFSAFVVIAMLNGLLAFPLLLSVIGPPGEVLPYDNPERIPTPSPEPTPEPSPEPSPIRLRAKHVRPFTRRMYPRVPSEISLSTITEESTSRHSPEIVVEPELVVETTTVTNTLTGASTVNTTTNTSENTDSQSEDSSKCNTPCGENITTTSSSTSNIANLPSGTTTVTTRVKATAKVKVEVHAPYSNNVDTSRHKRRRDSSSSRCSSARSSPT
ncbi:protein patched [Trichonephila clavata]|uniref:Protein patched n=1 Tax=Trichonephila clavata TaxID=2740835 RepID=A0A8X6K4N6_TRICU|nr:protein patched [Trichonephila clavata]